MTWASILIGFVSIIALGLMFFGRDSFKELPPNETSEGWEEQ